MLAPDRDRLAREPAYHYLLRRESRSTGQRSARSTTGATRHRRVSSRTAAGSAREVRTAKIDRAHTAGEAPKSSGGQNNSAHEAALRLSLQRCGRRLVIHEPEKQVVEQIFQPAAEGHGTKAIQIRLYREGMPSPTGKELWQRPESKGWS